MRALVLKAPGQLVYEDLPIPEPGPSEVVLQMQTACICNGSDPAILCGAAWSAFPSVMGHEGYGVVVRRGSGVTGVEMGDGLVWWFSMGAFAEYAVIDLSRVAWVKVPPGSDPHALPLLELLFAASRAVAAAAPAGRQVLILGAGPSGQLMAQLCRAEGAAGVSVCDPDLQRAALARRWGARDYDGRLDVIIDAFGDDCAPQLDTFGQALRRLRPQGTVVLYGQPMHGRLLNSYLLQSRSAAVQTPTNDIREVQQLANRAMALYLRGEICLKPLVTRTIGFGEIPRWIGHTQNDMKIIIEIRGGTAQ